MDELLGGQVGLGDEVDDALEADFAGSGIIGPEDVSGFADDVQGRFEIYRILSHGRAIITISTPLGQ